jgi:hypothetical protein
MRLKLPLHLMCLLVAQASVLSAAPANDGAIKFELWQGDKTMGPGFFRLTNPVSIDGRGTQGSAGNGRARITVVGGSSVQGSEFFSAYAHWDVEQCSMDQVTVKLGPANTIEARNATMTGCVVTFGARDVEEAPPAGSTIAVPGETANRLRLQGCVITEGRLFRTVTPSRTVLDWSDSTFTKVRMPEMVFNSDMRSELDAAGVRITRCRFVECEIPVSFMLATSDCAFEGCTITGAAPDQLRAPAIVQVTGTVPKFAHPRVTLALSKAAGSVGATLDQSSPSGVAVSPPAPVASLPSLASPTAASYSTTASTPAMQPTPVSAADGLTRRDARVHGLLIMELSSGYQAGKAAVMNAIALEGNPGSASTVTFNQQVGEHMTTALGEVVKHMQVIHGGWPSGFRIELGFEDKYSEKDGPSAAVACALLLDSMITGMVLDNSFAVTGDMNVDGSVQPIGGVRAKIRGATKGHCKFVAIPSKNESALGDVLLTEGPGPFAAVQIFAISKFEEAQAVAYSSKTQPVQRAVANMTQVLDLLQRSQSQMHLWLRDPRVIAKLQQVLVDAPNHVSAKYLLMHALGRTPTTLTLAGSLDAVDNGGSEIVGALRTRGQGDALKSQALGSSIGKLTLLRPKVDARVRPYLDGILKFANLVKEAQDRPPSSETRMQELRFNINNAAQSAEDALQRLMGDPSVIEELKL